MHKKLLTGLVLAASALSALAQTTAAPPTTRIRGVIQAVGASTLTFLERSGEVVELQLSPNVTVSEVYPITLNDVQVGSFIGTAALPQADGSQRAIAITVFPESARGTGEGHRPFDLMPQSTMTNATVAEVVAATGERTLNVKFKDGQKTIVVPQGVPVVTFRPADRSLLLPGASASISVQMQNEKPTATRISAGRNGFVLPY